MILNFQHLVIRTLSREQIYNCFWSSNHIHCCFKPWIVPVVANTVFLVMIIHVSDLAGIRVRGYWPQSGGGDHRRTPAYAAAAVAAAQRPVAAARPPLDN